MLPILHFVIDSRGWTTPLDRDILTALIQARLRDLAALDVQVRLLNNNWAAELPQEAAVTLLVLARPLT
jgi:hypothetical protein